MLGLGLDIWLLPGVGAGARRARQSGSGSMWELLLLLESLDDSTSRRSGSTRGRFEVPSSLHHFTSFPPLAPRPCTYLAGLVPSCDDLCSYLCSCMLRV
ncbi:hypothetical protein DFH07DRAFT_828360 [Mycena maculata]|uniref:Secreted protein n=1 Tax=Mycena maculata TaxID=230809 RepID=A0AAD7ISS9_9AGAR|nr:hypothetical protein DFH07DRAFT_828360 [Mycena maculata]